MWLVFLMMLTVTAAIQARVFNAPNRGRFAELLLVYLLAGYCGISQIMMAMQMLIHPDHLAEHLDIPFASPTNLWVGFIYLGAAVSASLTIWVRGNYLLGPAIVWSTFFAGATYAHIYTDRLHGVAITPLLATWTFATHGLISILLGGAYVMHRCSIPQLRQRR